ncbi:envelope stress response membrane protein PspB [Psychrobium sp. 1_MG-2023]|uniref:envelope stress response membrane protein PspB n=1 Tax=Psychrobium sp. 1_MG-2023 TaxID=3062624 RepID=UPI0026C2F6CD|nr:envelope stress response membrane protein PspB [Psychrobium sp. 1_MG-2023]MDP2562425.1 envelope stress response membrane protein PspB [Psychrobium sp. 1_MG-2023]
MDHGVVAVFIVPIALFLIFVAPIWLFLHYRSRRQVSQGLSDEEYQELTDLGQQAEAMAMRISTLESILDAEAPEWRNKQ